VIVVDGGRRIADVLTPIYRRLGLEWDPRTAGDLADHIPGITLDGVAHAVHERLADRHRLEDAVLAPWILDEGRVLATAHVAPAA
jgi:hypothetical protein